MVGSLPQHEGLYKRDAALGKLRTAEIEKDLPGRRRDWNSPNDGPDLVKVLNTHHVLHPILHKVQCGV